MTASECAFLWSGFLIGAVVGVVVLILITRRQDARQNERPGKAVAATFNARTERFQADIQRAKDTLVGTRAALVHHGRQMGKSAAADLARSSQRIPQGATIVSEERDRLVGWYVDGAARTTIFGEPELNELVLLLVAEILPITDTATQGGFSLIDAALIHMNAGRARREEKG